MRYSNIQCEISRLYAMDSIFLGIKGSQLTIPISFSFFEFSQIGKVKQWSSFGARLRYSPQSKWGIKHNKIFSRKLLQKERKVKKEYEKVRFGDRLKIFFPFSWVILTSRKCIFLVLANQGYFHAFFQRKLIRTQN